MKTWDSDRVQNKLINRLERQEKQQAFQRDRLLRFKLPEIHKRLSQALLIKNIIETENSAAISDLVLTGLKKALKSSEFDLKYFVAPIRDLVPRANPFALYMTQYIMEVIIDDPAVIEIYGTDLEIYHVVNEAFSQINIQFERVEKEVAAQIARDQSLKPGSREYEIALDQLMRKKLGEPLS
ncbi:MAG: DUF507 family protein [Desulfatiglans sp.]|jgi:hypothetical protein|nr:DUF507 family protein [Thermodesulfobacteriota bacterium]MEE4354371.1 DUF507 family protein [Desulfatiglans sp.]